MFIEVKRSYYVGHFSNNNHLKFPFERELEGERGGEFSFSLFQPSLL